MEPIDSYFPGLTELQRERFTAMGPLYEEWNARINVVSRKDMEFLCLRHILHSLAIGKAVSFRPGTRIMDVGCGGGFPGIPLAVLFPECRFTLVDSIGKKIRVVEEVSRSLGLENVAAVHGRAEEVRERTDFVVSRAVTEMKTFLGWVWDRIEPGGNNSLENGILYLKGGDLVEELAAAGRPYRLYDLTDWYREEFFQTKKLVYIPKKR